MAASFIAEEKIIASMNDISLVKLVETQPNQIRSQHKVNFKIGFVDRIIPIERRKTFCLRRCF
tara:strand:- start:1673 stop:1861 length:189 start_codon:yes stop_codon:yes gene_type:complete